MCMKEYNTKYNSDYLQKYPAQAPTMQVLPTLKMVLALYNSPELVFN